MLTRSLHLTFFALAALWSLNARAETPPAPTSASAPSPPTAPAPAPIPATSHEATPIVPLGPGQRSADPARVSGLERPAVEPGDAGRAFGTALLLPLRKAVEIQFVASDAMARLARYTDFGRRVEALLSPKEGEVKLLPTFFFESRHPVSFGARVVALGRTGEASLAVASGGPNDVFTQAHVLLVLPKPVPAHLLLEGMHDSRNDLEFLGVGQVPDEDTRNVFRPGAPHGSVYLERRSRAIASLDTPIAGGFSVVPSASVLISRVEDAPDSGLFGLSRVFEPTPSITDASTTRVVYAELAPRFTTRRDWVSRDPGAQLEGYAGYGTGVAGDRLHYLGAGGRAALFVPVVRRSNTFSPKIVLDAVVPLDDASLPFTVFVRQPEYRGFDLRRDKLSVIVSLDYRWVLSHYVAARLFADGATVAPRFADLVAHPPRVAAGFGFDIFNYRTDIVRFAFSASADGVRVLLGLGPPAASGDRQHRN